MRKGSSKSDIFLAAAALFLGFMLIASVYVVSAADYSSWSYRKNITINSSEVNGTHTNFPLLVRLTSDSDLAADAQDDGDDIVFTNSSGTKLDHEIELFNGSTGELVAWVRIPSLVNTSNTMIYMYYGNSTVGSQQNRTGVWDANYKGVWHMNETSGTSIADSTNNGYTGTKGGTSNPAPYASGMIGGAQSYVQGDSISTATVDASAFGSTYSMSVWAKAYNVYAMLRFFGDAYANRLLSIEWDDNPNLTATAYYSFSSSASTRTGVTRESWHLFAIVRSTTTVKFYLDGVQLGTDITTADGSYPQASMTNLAGSNGGAYVDELHLSLSARSADWIATEFNNQKNGSTFISLGGEQVSTAWYSSSWSYRKNVTINASQVNGSHTNFPVLVRMASDADLAADAQDDGDDILFAQGAVKLDHEIELFNETTGELVAWVRMPNLANTSDTTVYMYYGNSSVSSQQNRTGVWDANFKGVWHLPNGTTLTANDSTGTPHNGTLYNTPTAVAGQIDGAAGFARASSQYIGTASDAVFKPSAQNTYQFWIYPTVSNSYYADILRTSDANMDLTFWGANGVCFCTYDNGTKKIDGSDPPRFATSLLTLNTWHQLTAVSNGTTAYWYLDGTLQSSKTLIASITTLANSSLEMGGSSYNGFIDGRLDEVRFSDTARSAQWIRTEYNNQNSSTFLTLGGEQVSTAWYSSSWSYRKNVTINASQVNGSHTNFPVLVRMASDADLAADAQDDGDDLLFAQGAVKLDHEIELFNGTTGELVAWVRMPNLANTTDTTLYMYYGNPSVSSQQNRTGVWDANYKGVWHLGNGTILSGADSTSSGFNMTNYGASAISGKIDGAAGGVGGVLEAGAAVPTQNDAARTLEIWFKSASDGGSVYQMLSQGYGGSGKNSFSLAYNSISDRLSAYENDTERRYFSWTYDSDWHHLAVSYPGGGIENASMYLDGVAQTTSGSTGVLATQWYYLDIGHSVGDPTHDFNMGGLDEARMSSTARSAQWIRTEYNNQNSSTFLTLGSEQVSTAWYSSSWSNRKNITINASQVNGSHTNFPLLVRLSSDSDMAADAQDDGDDLLFAQGAVKLDHEIELFNGTTGELVAWVRMPNLANTSDTTLYMYYGNSSVSSQQNRTGVWAQYAVVYHLHDSAANVNVTDATGNHTINHTVNTNTVSVAGIVGPAFSFNGSGQYANGTGGTDLEHGSIRTASAWIYPVLGANATVYLRIFSNSQDSNNRWRISYSPGTNYHFEMRIINGGTYYGRYAPSGSMPPGRWYYVVGVYNGTTVSNIFVNGTDVTTDYGGSVSSAEPVGIAIGAKTSGDNQWNGTLDEIRVSGLIRSAQWIRTEYNNQKNGSTFLSLGSEEGQGDAPPDASLGTNPAALVYDPDGSITFDLKCSDDVAVGTLKLYGNWTGSWTANQTNSTSANDGWWNVTVSGIPNGVWQWDAWCNDSTGQGDWSGENRTFTVDRASAANYSNFSCGTTDFNSQGNIASVSGAVLEKCDWGNISWLGTVNASSANLNAYVNISFNFISLNSSALNSTFNSSANLSFYNLTYKQNPVIRRDGAFCPSSICSLLSYNSATGILLFNVSQFSNYTTGANANLSIWDDTDSQARYPNQNITFYANYTNITSGQPINGTGVYCNISFNVSEYGPFGMAFNATSLLYEYNRTFSSAGLYNWNVSCNGSISGYEPLNVSDTIAISSWCNATFAYRKNITINASEVNGSHTNFPLLVRLASDSDLAADAQDDGDDIFFTSSSCSKLDHEIELFNGTTGQLVAWVRMPTLVSTSDTTLYMYYGNSSVSSQQNRTGVWNANYKGVWHMNESGGSTIADSTSNSANGTVGGMSADPESPFGASSWRMDNGGSNNISLASALSLGTAHTISAWVRLDGTYSYTRVMRNTNAFGGTGIIFDGSSNNEIGYDLGSSVTNSTAAPDDVWFYATTVRATGAGNPNVWVYVNGNQVASGYVFYTNTLDVSWIVIQHDSNWHASHYAEVRASNDSKSAQWIQTEYNNQKNGSTFLTLGSEEGQGDTTPPTYSQNSTNSTTAGSNVKHSLYWQDAEGLSGCIFSFDNCTGTLVNDTWVPVTGSGNWSEFTKGINTTIGCTIRWAVTCNDTSNNWNYTSWANPFSYLTTSGAGESNLSCSITASGSCSYTKVLYLKNDTGGYMNAHAQNATPGTYPYVICCDSNSTLSYGCDDETVLKLNSTTNSHAQRGDYAGPGIIYGYSACLSAAPGILNCSYEDDACPQNMECLASMASAFASENNDTDAHVGPCDEYERKICCRVVMETAAPQVTYIPPTPGNNSRQTANSVAINVTVVADSSLNVDTCILEWNGANETMQKIGTGNSVTCNITKATSDATNYTFKVYANDSSGAMGSESGRQFRENDEPAKVVLTSPANQSHNTSRTPTFQWNAPSDADGDTLNYTINISCFPACSDDNRLVTDIMTNSYTPTTELKYFGDDNHYYNWSVRAGDGYEFGQWSDVWKLTIDTNVSIILLNDTVDFGQNRLPGYSDNTTDNSPYPFSLRNVGNCMIDVNLSAQDLLWDYASQPSDYFNYSVNWLAGEGGAFNWSGSQTSSANVPQVNQNVTFIDYLNYTSGNSSAEVEMYIEVPSGEPPGSKSSIIIFAGEYHGPV